MMSRAPHTSFRSLVAAAVLNKYRNVSTDEIAGLVSRTIVTVEDDDEGQLLARLRPIREFADDVHNQTIVLTLIERCWSNPPKLLRPLATLNRASFGKAEPDFRSTDFVEDFGGIVPTDRNEIPARLDEIERLSEETVRCLTGRRLEDQALLLAYIFGSVIRIHPFADGNGRTARLFVFYALRCWGRPLFEIPKVRNDPAWKDALNAAVEGDVSKLKREFHRRIKEAIS